LQNLSQLLLLFEGQRGETLVPLQNHLALLSVSVDTKDGLPEVTAHCYVLIEQGALVHPTL